MKKGWKIKTLGLITTSMADGPFGSNLKKEHYTTAREVRIIQLSNIGEEGWREENTKYTTFAHLETIKRSQVEAGNLVIAKMMPAGRAILCPDKEKAYVLSSDAVKAVLIDTLCKEFILYQINSPYFRNQVYENVSGSGRVRTSLTKLRDCTLQIPSLSEQKEIVEYLDSSFAKIDTLKANAAKNLDEAKALFQSALKEALEPRDNWEEKTLGEVGNFKRGGNFSKKDFIENGFPCIHYGQIHMKFGIETFKHLSSVPVEMVKPDRCAQKGDLIIAITSEDDAGSCKCTAWMGDYEVYIGGHTAIYHHSMEPKFVSYYFMSPYFQKAKLEYTHGFKVVEINPKDIAKISVHIPPLSEQQEIVSRLDSLNEKVNTLQQNYSRICSECDALKQSILRQVFE